MAKSRAKINFVVELNSIEFTVPSQEAGQAFVKKLNVGLRGALKKALGIPKESKLKDSFSGVISGRIEGAEDGGFVLVEFGSVNEDSDEEDDDEDDSSEENAVGKSQEQGPDEGLNTEDGDDEDPSDAESGDSGSAESKNEGTRRFKRKQ